jgi:ABC-2 type transport system permease protein
MSSGGEPETGRSPAGILNSGWFTVLVRELRDLWFGTRGPGLVLIFSLLLSLITYLAATNTELNLIDQKDTVNLVLQITLGMGVLLSLLFAADAISGERERETLETLLLTPLSRREIAAGKLVAVLSTWPVLMLVSIPYVWALRVGASVSVEAIVAGLVVGTLLAIAFASLGIIVSIFSESNRVSLALGFLIFLVLMAPTQLPGGATNGWLGNILVQINPVNAGSRFLNRIIVSDHTWGQEADLLIAPAAAAVVVATLAVVLAGRIRLQGGIGR